MNCRPAIIKETSRGIETVDTLSELYSSERIIFLNGKVDSDTCQDLMLF